MRFRSSVAFLCSICPLLALNSSYAANGFNFNEAFTVAKSLPNISSLVDQAATIDNQTSVTVQFSDGKDHTLSSTDSTESLKDLTNSNSVTLKVDGNQVKIHTSATSFREAYTSAADTYDYTLATVVNGRPWTLSWSASRDEIDTKNTFVAFINGEKFTLVLPVGSSLADLSGTTVISILDSDGSPLVENIAINSLSDSELAMLGKKLNILDLDLALGAVQGQAATLSMNMISDEITNELLSHSGASQSCSKGDSKVWVGSRGSDLDGDAPDISYEAQLSTYMIGTQLCSQFGIVGLAIGESKTKLVVASNDGSTHLNGDIVAPYLSIPFLQGQATVDLIAMFENLNGSTINSTLAEPMLLDGSRTAYRLSGKYYYSINDSLRLAAVVGGMWIKDDIEGSYLGTENKYGYDKGVMFSGANLFYNTASGYVSTGLTFYDDISSTVKNSASVLNNGTENYVDFRVSGALALRDNISVGLNATSTIQSKGMDSSAVGLTLNYSF